MTQNERVDYLVNKLNAETGKDFTIPEDREEKRQFLRALFNVRVPKPLPDDVMRVQDEYLQERRRALGDVSLSDIPEIRAGLSLWQGDITRLAVDAIVNAANSQMLGCFIPLHNCIDNCIHTYAGAQLRIDCYQQMLELRGKYGMFYEHPVAVPMMTDGYNLPAKKVIHVVGPQIQGKYGTATPKMEQELADCYRNTLDMCAENDLKSVAFCCISTGVYRFPKDKAAKIAVDTVTNWMQENPGKIDRVIFNVFKDDDREIYEELLS